MGLIVEQPAAHWYKSEMELEQGDHVRIYVRLGGCGSVHPGLSLGVMKDEPRDIGAQTEVEGIHFYMEQDNMWYLEEKDLHISFDSAAEEIMMEVK
ncbi:HesB/YadR/YfhF family protein [Paenibacillus septentrionalis]|uniref:HesB/YadR/YfhF family protein n=1 Tax=Paenibacillus septentrionalis TaxID=429342 RepID=A0ABW1V541_9BACL